MVGGHDEAAVCRAWLAMLLDDWRADSGQKPTFAIGDHRRGAEGMERLVFPAGASMVTGSRS